MNSLKNVFVFFLLFRLVHGNVCNFRSFLSVDEFCRKISGNSHPEHREYDVELDVRAQCVAVAETNGKTGTPPQHVIGKRCLGRVRKECTVEGLKIYDKIYIPVLYVDVYMYVGLPANSVIQIASEAPHKTGTR